MHKLLKKFLLDYKDISEYYIYLVEKTKNHKYVGITNEWLIDNYYLIVEYKNNILDEKKGLSKILKNSNNIYSTTLKIVTDNNYNINYKLLVKELNSYQRKNKNYFTYKELTLLKPILYFIYTAKLNEICKSSYKQLEITEKVSTIITELGNEDVDLSDFTFKDKDLKHDFAYIFELNNQLKELGKRSNKFFKELNTLLEENNISLKQIINDEYQNRINENILVSNIFNNLKDIIEYTQEDIFEHISKCEKYLMEDEIYEKMTIESKELYRRQIVKLAKKNKCNEISYIEQLLEKATFSDYHIGFQLFKNKPQNLKMNSYIALILIISIIIAVIISNYFIKLRIIGFLILIIPVSQIMIQITNQILNKFVKAKPLPKMDYSKGIPEESATMVVIPTIISNEEKIKEMFDTLETFYIVNKTKNLYFTLLGDVKASNKEIEPYDKEISKYGVEYAKKLNKKYKQNIFFFTYRKRVWNEKENTYLGYERKRGALLQFNRLLLHKLSKDEIKEYYNVSTLTDFNQEIKYVITLDTDTKLVLNSALNLVGCMAHPLNRPVLNKEETKVINGYGLLQPRLNVDIEATNKSLYSQIFAGIGGFDTYSVIVPNTNQDCFQEGSFVGKGIYDLETFDKVLYDRFPDNLILSHDLLEGNYIRCGYVADIEFVDDFPSKFLVDVTRQHRWARGDAQIMSFLLPKTVNKNNELEKNPINSLGKFKIFDNIARMFLYPSLLLIVLLSLFFTNNSIIWIAFSFLVIALPIISFLRSKLYTKKERLTTIYYKNLMFGGKSLFLRAYIVFATIPYYSYLYMDAFIRTVYRLFVSHKNLLNWITAEEVEKTAKNDLKTYLLNFKVNLILSLILIVIGLTTPNILMIVIAIVFISAPFILHYVSSNIELKIDKLNDRENNELLEIAKRTWNYFKENLTEENNYLISDNYQENRENKLDYRTSPTDIAFSLTSVIAAQELNFITKEEAITYLRNIINSIKSLEKWNGHLYNWYSIKSKKTLLPRFVSTVDSGNLVAALITTESYLEKNEVSDLSRICSKLIDNTNFKKLYTKKNVLSIGYEENEERLSVYNYNKFASESRLTSFIAISKGDIPSKHWFCLDKSLTTYKNNKGLISWSGTAFEYYMPNLFMKNYPNTLLDESYSFAYLCQKSFIESVDKKLPWGISESAYNELDNSENYKYRSFSVPYLKAREDKSSRIVISPYSSLMATEFYPNDIYNNIIKFKKMNMLSKYGLYESYDLENKGVVKACFAHHQGMSLIGITNYLLNDVMKDYFHQNVGIKTFEILLKEKVQVKADIDMKMAKYKKYNYKHEKIENDIRSFSYISDMPEVSVLSNGKFSLLMNDRGDSFSRYRTLQLNRYRKITEQDYGMFLYIKDLDTKKIWSNTYAPMNEKPDKYEVVFAADKIKYSRKDGLITTKTEIIVTRDHHASIEKITFMNDSDDFKELELTTYTEPILSENTDDTAHKVFNSMFLSSSYDNETNSLITMRKSRTTNMNCYMINRLIIDNPKDKYTYETDRFKFLGRNRTYDNPLALENKLTNSVGTNIEPIMSLRNVVEIAPKSSKSVYFINGFGRSIEQLNDIIKSYETEEKISKAFQVANLMNIISTKNLNITGDEMRTYNMMLNYLYQTTHIAVNEERRKMLKENALAQNGLWKFGVSGDRPIILVNISDISDLSFVFEILKAFEYFKNKSIFVDIIIINSEENQYAKIIKREIDDELYRIYTVNSFYHTPGSVTVINKDNITDKEKTLLKIIPRLMFNITSHTSLKDEVNRLQNKNRINDYQVLKQQNNIEMPLPRNLDFNNTFGGFKNNGCEYEIINKDTPTPWSNVIANKNFGTIITNNGCGYTYAYNSGEFKISSWTNEMIQSDKSEGIKINGELFEPDRCTHGFGYSILESETKELKQKLIEFVAKEDTVKLYILKLSNKLDKKQKIDVNFFINPTLGTAEEKTSRHILTEYMNNDNYLKLRNVYSIDFSDVNVFMSTSEKITKATENKILVKDITTEIELEKDKEKTIIFSLGCSKTEEELLTLVNKYSLVKTATDELKSVKEKWRKNLNIIKVETKDNSFNYMLNGWYLYQAMSSRIMAKAGFYQVSGAFGYRDQLQDAMNICMVNPEYTKKQIIINASHQFVEGDVLHWWHEKNHFGLRSRYKDDFLWLVYATVHYLEITKDFDILKVEVPFVIGDILTEHEAERGMTFTYSDTTESLLDHCLLSINHSMNNIGRHNLPLMGGGDWNDGMNKVGIKGKGESVWLGFFLYIIIDKFTKMMNDYDKKFDTSKYLEFNEKLKDALNTSAWDGSYYLRAYFDNGDKLGSHENEECKIDLISQSFSILSNVIEKDRITPVINAVEEKLVDKDKKIIKLLTPAFKESLNDPGYIKNYPEGIRENGGQYTHATSWYIMALIKTGNIDKAYNYYQMINPINRSNEKDEAIEYAIEPYVVSADIYSSARFPARGGWTWYTGSAGWFYRVGIEEIIGFKKNGTKLYIKPNVPSSWNDFAITYTNQNAIYKIEVIIGKEEKIVLNNKKLTTDYIDLKETGEYNIKVYIKKRG